VGPATGIVAAFTTSFTEAIGGISDYVRNISMIKHKSVNKDQTPSVGTQRRSSLVKVESHNPVTRAANYSPDHIAEIAYRMAEKSVPTSAIERKRRREELDKVDPAGRGIKPRRTVSRNRALFGTPKEHGKAYDAAVETGRFVDTMLDVGLRGVSGNILVEHNTDFPSAGGLLL